jgi:hypothetical protein
LRAIGMRERSVDAGRHGLLCPPRNRKIRNEVSKKFRERVYWTLWQQKQNHTYLCFYSQI